MRLFFQGIRRTKAFQCRLLGPDPPPDTYSEGGGETRGEGDMQPEEEGQHCGGWGAISSVRGQQTALCEGQQSEEGQQQQCERRGSAKDLACDLAISFCEISSACST